MLGEMNGNIQTKVSYSAQSRDLFYNESTWPEGAELRDWVSQWLNSAGTGRNGVPPPVSGVPPPEIAVPPPKVVVPPPGNGLVPSLFC